MSAACAMDPFQFAAFNDEEEDGEEQVDDEDEESNEPPAVEEQEDNEVTYRLKGLIEVPEPYQLPERTDAAFVPDVRVFEPVKVSVARALLLICCSLRGWPDSQPSMNKTGRVRGSGLWPEA